MRERRHVIARLVLACGLLSGGPLAAQEASELASAAPPVPEAGTTSEAPSLDLSLPAFVDGLMAGLMARDHLAGAVVSVVRRDSLLLARAYGVDRIDPKRSADPTRSLFRIGSISKTFTYVAAMQLVEAGLVQLDDPVELHLPESAHPTPDGFDQPIRVRHLLTHTAGFEDTALGHLFARDPSGVLSLQDYIERHRPRRVRPPGQVAVYSNYSVALLGLLVATVRNEPFEAVIENHLTGPLGMARTTFREPLVDGDPRRIDATLMDDLAQGFTWSGGRQVAQGFEFIAHGAPAGSISASATDMARWMRLLLGEGELDGVRVIQANTLRRMREERFANTPDTWPIGLGFLIERFGPHEAYGHAGATLYFHSNMILVPTLDLGIFVSMNSSNARADVREVVRRVIEHMSPDAAPTDFAVVPQDTSRYTGAYRSNRRPYVSAEKLLLALPDTEIRSDGEALLVPVGGASRRFLSTGSGRFRKADGNLPLQFLESADGQVTGYVMGTGIAVFERVPWPERADVLMMAIALASWIAVARLFGFWRSGRRRHGPGPRPGLAAVKTLTLFSALAWLAFAAIGIAAAMEAGRLGNDLLYVYPTLLFRTGLTLATVCAVMTVLELLALPTVWRSDWRAWPKLRHSLGVLLLAAACFVLWQWNLVAAQP